VKGNVSVSLLYNAAGGSIEHTEIQLPFTEVFETEENCEEDFADVRCEVSEKSFSQSPDANGNMRVISIEVLIKAELSVRRMQHISYLCDCYFYGAETCLEHESVNVEQLTLYPKVIKNLREQAIQDKRMPRISSVYNVVAKPKNVSVTESEDGVSLSCVLDVSVLYLSENPENPICCFKSELPIEHFEKEIKGACFADVECEHISYSLNGAGEVEIRAALEISFEAREEKELDTVCEISKGEASKSAELVIFFAKDGETLWDIGKRFRVSQEEIVELNRLDSDNGILASKRLIIPCM
jgi:hypothetical protein